MFELDAYIYVNIAVYILGLSATLAIAIIAQYLKPQLKPFPSQVFGMGDTLLCAQTQHHNPHALPQVELPTSKTLPLRMNSSEGIGDNVPTASNPAKVSASGS